MSTEFTDEELESSLEVWMINNRDEAIDVFGENLIFAIKAELESTHEAGFYAA